MGRKLRRPGAPVPEKPFSLLVKPAGADCNLGCKYCFYLKKKSVYPDTPVPRMSDTVLEALVRSYMRTDQPVYSFGWQGGEPTLMGVDFFRKVTAFQSAFGKPGSRVANGLQTNATLISDELAEHLARHRFLVGASIDGPEQLHDTYRRMSGGGPTHSRVMDGVARLRRHGVDVNALVLVSKANVTHAREVYEYLKYERLVYQQYIPCVEFLGSGEPAPYAITGEEWGDFLCQIFDLWNSGDQRRVSIRHHDALMAFLLDGSRQMCTMGGRCDDYFVVEHTGDVYPCDFFVEPELRLGNIVHDSWTTIAGQPLRNKFAVRKAEWAAECSTCRHLPYCSGDCIKHREHAPAGTGSWLCNGWSIFYDRSVPVLRKLAQSIAAQRGLSGPLWEPSGFDPEAPCFCGSGRKARNCHLRSLNQSSTAAHTVSPSTP